ncbi:MAG: 50S ribosomal protein L6 [Gammaproteobacteria bacterium]
MSRVGKQPIELPKGVEVGISGSLITVKGAKGTLQHEAHGLITVRLEDDAILVTPNDESKLANALSGTTRAVLQNMVTGVSAGFERKLEIVGVGYRAAVQGSKLNLSLGYSHPVEFPIPDGIAIETPTQTEVVVRGIDKQQVGQVAANIRAYRRPEPYKGKGVRYSGEQIVKKEAKKN